MAVKRKHAAPEAAAGGAVGKMAGDRIAVFENMAVAIDDLYVLFHRILLCQRLIITRRAAPFVKASARAARVEAQSAALKKLQLALSRTAELCR
jgi:hypothetical protein